MIFLKNYDDINIIWRHNWHSIVFVFSVSSFYYISFNLEDILYFFVIDSILYDENHLFTQLNRKGDLKNVDFCFKYSLFLHLHTWIISFYFRWMYTSKRKSVAQIKFWFIFYSVLKRDSPLIFIEVKNKTIVSRQIARIL